MLLTRHDQVAMTGHKSEGSQPVLECPVRKVVHLFQKAQKRGMNITESSQNRRLSGTPVRRKSVYL